MKYFKSKIFWIFSIWIFISLLVVGYLYFNTIDKKNINKDKESHELFVQPGSSYEDIKQTLLSDNIIIDEISFDRVAQLMSYKKLQKPASGRYVIKNNMSNRQLVSMLRAGNQSPVNLTFNNARTIKDLSGKLSQNILADSTEIFEFLNSNLIDGYGFTKETLMTLFIPNTYKVYWDITPVQLLERMIKEHQKFWNKERVAKAENLKLSLNQVYTLASIVDKESLQLEEKPRIAGVYLNRLNNNILLQADPTVVFAVGDFEIRRVLNKHLEYDSPYNTYKYAGLPPGPICMASISGIDSVLDYEKHEFLYFCAKPESNGGHAFSKTLSGHNQNALTYRKWLNERGIKR